MIKVSDFLTLWYKKLSAEYPALLHENLSKITLNGCKGSSLNLFFIQQFSEQEVNQIHIFPDEETAQYALNEAEHIHGKNKAYFLPDSGQLRSKIKNPEARMLLRSEVEIQLLEEKPILIYTYPEAISEKLIAPQTFQKDILRVRVGEKIGIAFLNEWLLEFGYERCDLVTRPGEFSVRGGIVDVFAMSSEYPYRMSFFGDEVESIKLFDIETQLSTSICDECIIAPLYQDGSAPKVNLLEILPRNSTIILYNSLLLSEKFHQIKSLFSQNEIQATETDFTFWDELKILLKNHNLIEIEDVSPICSPDHTYELEQKATLHYEKNFELLLEDLNTLNEEGYSVWISFSSERQISRLSEIFFELSKSNQTLFNPILARIHSGFIDKKLKIALFTDHEIFHRYQKIEPRTAFTKSKALTLKELVDLKVGDYIIHSDHGVGKFMGLKNIEVAGKPQEAIKLEYANHDILYVSVHALGKISKYQTADVPNVKLNKLGSPAWKNLKSKTKKRIKELAFDLLHLYAKRKLVEGFSFPPDDYLMKELEASFEYEETPDQIKTIQEVKADMESSKIMDRLVCGDVGFGKTEVAIRAAFKACTAGKQVAVLVPTTLLAFQHFNSFQKRLSGLPVRVDYLSRFRSAKDTTAIKKQVAEGKIDILIGTHALVSKNIVFKDLGLLIIDEEHKFGVSVKEKLKTLKSNVDTLTLTATPIPRTLQFSLMSARDLSVIKTPPPNRQPIHTEIIAFDPETIQEAILFELNRGGQIFFVNNRIDNLVLLAQLIRQWVPEIKISIGHGQMEGKELEKVMMQFLAGETDMLLSTTIIESGLDVPNANTIFINEAHQYGLADLHQMRGRVGRSDKKAFCYLITNDLSSLTREAKKRLQAIEDFSDLGSGFHIAMKDLEIRGAGDILGPEQSGFINEIGFDTYQKILQEAIQELKSNDFKDTFEGETYHGVSASEVSIDVDIPAFLPDSFINKVEERFSLYRKLAHAENLEDILSFEKEINDRFGSPPEAAKNLLEIAKLKLLCSKLSIEKLTLKKGTLLIHFPTEGHPFYQTNQFTQLLAFFTSHPHVGVLKEKESESGKQLLFRREKVFSLKTIQSFLNELLEKIETGVV